MHQNIQLERRKFSYPRKIKIGKDQDILFDSYNLLGEAFYLPYDNIQSISLTPISQTLTWGIDRISFSIDRSFIDECRFQELLRTRKIPHRLHLRQDKGKRFFIDFQRELFNTTDSLLSQCVELFQVLIVAGLFKVPLWYARSDDPMCNQLRTRNFYHGKKARNTQDLIFTILENIKIKELEVFFDSPIQYMLSLDAFNIHGVKLYKTTPYSQKHEKLKGVKQRHSIFKQYDKLERELSHKSFNFIPKIIKDNRYRIEVTLSNENLGGKFNLKIIDYTIPQIVVNLAPIIRHWAEKDCPSYLEEKQFHALHPQFQTILTTPHKDRLKFSHEESLTRFGAIEVLGEEIFTRDIQTK